METLYFYNSTWPTLLANSLILPKPLKGFIGQQKNQLVFIDEGVSLSSWADRDAIFSYCCKTLEIEGFKFYTQ